RWRPGRVVHLAAGNQSFALANASRAGDLQVTRLALVPASAGAWRSEAAGPRHVIRERGGVGPLPMQTLRLGRPFRLDPWQALADSSYVSVRTGKPTQASWIRVRRRGRRYFGIVQ